MDFTNMTVLELIAEHERILVKKEQHKFWSAKCYLKKKAKEFGMTPEEYLTYRDTVIKQKDGRTRPRKYFHDKFFEETPKYKPSL